VVALDVLLLVWALLVVKFLVVAFWMQDQMYQRAARFNIVAALICLAAGLVYWRGWEPLAFAAAVVAVVLGISSFRLVRTGRG
jgi:membrane-associated PAP2 superfamily phosphatase